MDQGAPNTHFGRGPIGSNQYLVKDKDKCQHLRMASGAQE